MGWPPLPAPNLLAQSARWLTAQMISFNNLIAGTMSIDGVEKIVVNSDRTSFNSVTNFNGGVAGNGNVIDVAVGVLSITRSFHIVDAEDSDGDDNIDTITSSGGNLIGDMVIIRSFTSTRDLTFTESGNISIDGGTTLKLTSAGSLALFVFTGSKWKHMAQHEATIA